VSEVEKSFEQGQDKLLPRDQPVSAPDERRSKRIGALRARSVDMIGLGHV